MKRVLAGGGSERRRTLLKLGQSGGSLEWACETQRGSRGRVGKDTRGVYVYEHGRVLVKVRGAGLAELENWVHLAIQLPVHLQADLIAQVGSARRDFGAEVTRARTVSCIALDRR